jgi:hypothetical protein
LFHSEQLPLGSPASLPNTIQVIGTKLADRIDLIQLPPTTDTEIDAAVATGLYKHEYEYTITNGVDQFQQQVVTYHFWVSGVTTRSNNHNMSIDEARRSLTVIPSPYMIFLKPKQAGSIIVDSQTVNIPVRYVQTILRGLRRFIDADTRYTVRFTRDFTLRDSLQHGKSDLSLKSLHEEWEIFRKAQPYNINRWQWNKAIESMIGHKYDDPNVRVPSRDRELYDETYQTDTRFGLGEGQSFTDGSLAIQTVLADLTNPLNDFYPVDINALFTQISFDTTDDIKNAMDVIYETFGYEHVNRIYFSLLLDALSVNREYAGLLKTSMIALHGVRPFQVAGVFDD